MRLVIELKRDAISGVVLNNLFTNTPLQTTFGIVLLAIDGGQPRTLNLRELLERFVSHRREVVTRRSRFELRNAERRIHVVEGLLVAQDIIDLVITIIRRSRDPDEARWGLMHVLAPSLYEHERFRELPRLDLDAAKAQMEQLVARARAEEPKYAGLQHRYEDGGFTEEQAKQILEMRLQRLTGIQREELFTELISLTREIARLRDILENESSLLDVVKAELREVREKFGDERRTEITGEADELTSEDLIAEEDMVVTVSHAGYVKRSPLSEYRSQRRGGRGKTGASMKEDDFVSDLFVASTHAYLMPITTRGKLYWLKVHEIPAASRTARGKPIINVVQMGEGEKLASILVTKGFEEGRFVFFVTRKGVVKRTDLNAFSNVRSAGIIALGIEDGDSLVAVFITDGSKDILLSTARGMSIRFAEAEVRSMGRAGLRREGHHARGGRRGGGCRRGGARHDHPHRDRERLREADRGGRVPGPGPRRQGHHRHQDHRAERDGGRPGPGEGPRRGDAGHQRRDAHPDQGARHLGHRAQHPRGPAHLAGERRGEGQRHLQAAGGGGGER